MSRTLILEKLIHLRADKNIVIYIKNFLQNRYSTVRFGNATSEKLEFKSGVPQGSPLSPILFNIFCSDVLENCRCQKAQYADDIAIWAVAPSVQAGESLLNHDINCINN